MDFWKEVGGISNTFRHGIVQTKYKLSFLYTLQLCDVIVNVETGPKMFFFFYKQLSASPWLNTFTTAESWLNIQESNLLNIDNIECPNTKWVFVKFSNIEVKAVLDRQQPPLGTRLLPDWLRSLASWCQMVSLDTFNDNLCLWRCNAIDQGALLHQSTQAARELTKSYFNM